MWWNELEPGSEASVSKLVQSAGFQHEYHKGAGPQMNLSRFNRGSDPEYRDSFSFLLNRCMRLIHHYLQHSRFANQ